MAGTSEKRGLARSRRRGLSGWTERLTSSESIIVVTSVVSAVLSALTLHSKIVTGGIVVLGGGYFLVAFVSSRGYLDSGHERTLSKLAERIEDGPPGIDGEPLPQFKDSKRLMKAEETLTALETLLEENGRLCVIRLHGEDILEPIPGIRDDLPMPLACQQIVGAVIWAIETAPELSDEERLAAADLRGVVSVSLRRSDPLDKRDRADKLRQDVADRLRRSDLQERLVPLVDARPEAIERDVTKWLVDLFKDLGCTYGVFSLEHAKHVTPAGPIDEYVTRADGLRYVSGVLHPWLSKGEFNDVFAALDDAVGSVHGLNMDLLRIRCAVIAAAAELDLDRESLQRLRSPGRPSSWEPEDRAEEAALEVRWLVDRKAGRLAHARGLTGAFDRLAVIGPVTSGILGQLSQGLGLDVDGVRELSPG